jgi:hypothetical protein
MLKIIEEVPPLMTEVLPPSNLLPEEPLLPKLPSIYNVLSPFFKIERIQRKPPLPA